MEYVFFSLAFLGLILKFKMMEIKVRVSEESLAHSRAHSHLLLPSLAYSRYIYNPSSSLLSRLDVTREFRRSFHLSSNLSVPLCLRFLHLWNKLARSEKLSGNGSLLQRRSLSDVFPARHRLSTGRPAVQARLRQRPRQHLSRSCTRAISLYMFSCILWDKSWTGPVGR